MSVVLADLGGTHLRLASARTPHDIQKFKIADYSNLETLLKQHVPDISSLYLASAIHPRNGLIEDKRFGDKSHWLINLSDLKKNLSLQTLSVLNDLEAATYGLSVLGEQDLIPLAAARRKDTHFDSPPKILIGIGTGIGHAFLFEKQGQAPMVQRSHGGHLPVMALSAHQRDIVKQLEAVNNRGRDLIVEDIVSGYGFSNLLNIMSEENAVRMFWEFLGLYCNALVSVSGAYGGVYLTGGLSDEFFLKGKTNPVAFENYFRRPMVPVVVESLAATPVYYVRQPNMPITGLSTLVKP